MHEARDMLRFSQGLKEEKREVRKMYKNTSVWGRTATGNLPYWPLFTFDVTAMSTKEK